MNYAIILSGGIGTRLGLDIPKQYYEVNKKPIIKYVIDTLLRCDFVDGIVIVAAEEWQEYISQQISDAEKFLGFASPGENRQLSIYNGLCFLKKHMQASVNAEQQEDDTFVLIQDAARPNTSVALYQKCFDIQEGEDGVMPVLPMKDTIYVSTDGKKVSALLDRNTLFAGQAPESFRFWKYLEANERLLPMEIKKINGSTEPAMLAGMNIRMTDGDENNYKITTEVDLQKFLEDRNKIKDMI